MTTEDGSQTPVQRDGEAKSEGLIATEPHSSEHQPPTEVEGLRGIGREALGRAIYLALYEHEGAVWAANESKDVWYAVGDRFRLALTNKPNGDGSIGFGRIEADPSPSLDSTREPSGGAE